MSKFVGNVLAITRPLLVPIGMPIAFVFHLYTISSKSRIFQMTGKILRAFSIMLFMSACAGPKIDFNATPLQQTLGLGEKTNGYKLSVPNFKRIKALVEAGADVNVVNGFGTALTIASEQASPEIVDYLIAHGAEVNQKVPGGFSPLILAAEKGRLDIVKLLVSKGADINLSRVSSRPYAIVGSPLTEAAYSGRYDIVEYLISNGADVSKQAGVAFVRASEGMGIYLKSIDRKEMALEGSKKNHRTYEYITIIDLLRSKGANVNSVNYIGDTALHYPAMVGNAKVVRYFLKIGVNPKIASSSGGTPLIYAQEYREGILQNSKKPEVSDKFQVASKEILRNYDEVIAILTPVTNNNLDSSTQETWLLDKAKDAILDCIKLTASNRVCEMLPQALSIGCSLIARAQFSNSICIG